MMNKKQSSNTIRIIVLAVIAIAFIVIFITSLMRPAPEPYIWAPGNDYGYETLYEEI